MASLVENTPDSVQIERESIDGGKGGNLRKKDDIGIMAH